MLALVRTTKWLLAFILLVYVGNGYAACPGCCSSHGGISNFCGVGGRIRCNDGTTSPSCSCSSCGVSGGTLPPTCTGGQIPSGSGCICPFNQVLITGTCRTLIKPETGWWWNPGESGRGYFIEQKGSSIFMAGFLYDLAGNPDWFVANGTVTSPNIFTAQMLHFSDGQTLLGGYRAPRATTALGEVRLEFSSSTQAQMRWPGGELPLVRFQFGNSALETPESGWWWNPSESGRGFSIEIQGNVLFVAGYMYEDSGKPVWYTASGTLASTTRFSGRWERFRDGQGIGQPYRQPVTVTPDAGSVLFNFLTPTTGQLTLPDGRVIAVQRFGF